MGVLNTILDLVFPSSCFVCGQKGTDLCLTCLSDSQKAERESAEWIFPLFDYRNPNIKKAVWLLKYKNKKKIAEVFAEAIYGHMLEELGDLTALENFKNPLVIPIPLSDKRLRERKFNQAELVARHLCSMFGEQKNLELHNDILIKPKETKHQAHIQNKKERLKNVIGSFGLKNKEKIKDRNVILIDDVTTTGATLSEAKKVLRANGARKIIAFTLAH